MFPPKEVLLNSAMRFAAVRSLAQRRHNTGIMADPAEGEKALARFTSDLPGTLHGARILELGPGQGSQLARAATSRGASYAAFDIQSYLDPAMVRDLDIDYRVDPRGQLAWPARSFDIVWSHSVLEHVRDPAGLLDQVHRVLDTGGHHIASIDLETHLGGREDPQRMYEFLRYPPWLWRVMTSNRSTYVNGLRLSDWRRAHERAGFEILSERTTPARCGIDALRSVPYLTDLSDEDLLTKHVVITSSVAT